MVVKHRAGRSGQGLSGFGNVCVGRDIPKLHGLLCGYVTRMKSSATKNTPPKSMGFLCVSFHLRDQ